MKSFITNHEELYSKNNDFKESTNENTLESTNENTLESKDTLILKITEVLKENCDCIITKKRD